MSTGEGVAKGIYPEIISHQKYKEILETNTKCEDICKPLFDGLARQAQSRINPDSKRSIAITLHVSL